MKTTFAGLALCLLAAGATRPQHGSRPKGERADKGETMAGFGAEHKVVGTVTNQK